MVTFVSGNQVCYKQGKVVGAAKRECRIGHHRFREHLTIVLQMTGQQ